MSTVNGFQVGSETLKYNYESLDNYNTPNFSTSSSTAYAVGDYVMYNGKLYKCTTATTGGTWVSGSWAEAVLSDDVSDLTRQLSVVEPKSSINNIFQGSIFTVGTILNTGKFNNKIKYRFSTSTVTQINFDCRIVAETGWRYILVKCDSSGNMLSYYGFDTSANVIIESGEYIKITLARNPDDTSETAGAVFLQHFFYIAEGISRDEYSNTVDALSETYAEELCTEIPTENFVRGSVGFNNKYTNISHRICTNAVQTATRDFAVKARSGFRVMIHYLNDGGTSIVSSSAYEAYQIKAVAKGQKYKIVIARTVEDTTETADIATFMAGVILYAKNDCQLVGKTFAVIGDSYLAGYTIGQNKVWCALIARKYGMNIYNYAESGQTMSTYVLNNYSSMTDDADYICVVAGRNDYNQQVPLATFKAAVDSICLGLVNKYPGKKIFFGTPWHVDQSLEAADHQSFTILLQDYTDAIIEECAKYSIPVFDASRNSGVTTASTIFRSMFFLPNADHPDGDVSHLNASGMEFVMPKYESFMLGL